MRNSARFAGLIICAWILFAPATSRAELPKEVAVQVTRIDESLAKIARLYRAKKYRDAAKLLTETEQAISRVALELTDAERAELAEQLAHWRRRSEAAKRLLADQKTSGAANSGVSFTKDVAPILVANCARCHIAESRGGLSMASFEALSRGSENGIVLFPGDGQASRLYEVLDTGDMPRGGNRLPDEALATIRTWIDQGAKFDGENPAAMLGELNASTSTPTNMPTVTAPTGTETVSFSSDVAGVFVEHCAECHGGNNPRANLSFDNFTRLLAGGDTGPLFTVGKPDESLLVGKLKGTAGGARMPMGRDPLPAATIALVEKWITEGATFDGAAAGTPMREVWETALAAKLSAEELSDKRAEFAAKHWKLAIPDTTPATADSKSFHVVGNPSESVLKEIAAIAESQSGKIAQHLRIPRGKEWVKGRVTIFVFQRRVDYTEFAQMVEQRGVPQEVMGHWRYSALDPYVCLVLPSDETASLRPPVATQLAGLGMAGLGELPAWFVQGMAKAIAARIEGRDPSVRAWDSQIAAALPALQNVELFLRADASSGANNMAAYGLCKAVLDDGRRYGKLITALREGTSFNDAVTRIYGADPQTLVQQWAANQAPAP